ncbi:MAG: MMPL family transporter [Pirellulales bacterium]
MTTAVGLGSLALSDIAPIHDFGIYAPVGVVAGFLVLMALLPGALDQWRGPPRQHKVATAVRRGELSAEWLGARIVRHADAIVVGSVVAMGVGTVGLLSLTTAVDFKSLFAPDSRIYEDYDVVENKLGPLVPLEIVVRFDNDSGMNMLDQLETIGEIEDKVRALDSVGSSLSAATLGPDIPSTKTTRGIARRRILDRQVLRNEEHFESLRMLAETDDARLWRISTRVPALSGVPQQQCLADVKSVVEPVLSHIPGASAVYTGVMPLVARAQEILLRDLIISFTTAFAIVALIMIAALKSWRCGLLAMVPNLFPAIIVFGAMGWLRIPVDVGAMMTASVAFGIAVDDTMHMMTWFRSDLDTGQDVTAAVLGAFHHCGRAMTQTTLICGLGMFVFAVSDFEPTRRFAWLMFLLLSTALVGDLVLLPALLAGSVGRRIFAGRDGTPQRSAVANPSPSAATRQTPSPT